MFVNENIADVWFIEEDSPLSTDLTQLDLITEENSIGEIETVETEKTLQRFDLALAQNIQDKKFCEV